MGCVIDDKIDQGAECLFGDGCSQSRAIVLSHGKIGANDSLKVVALDVAAQMRRVCFDVECDEALQLEAMLPVNRAAAIEDTDLDHMPWLNSFGDSFEAVQKGAVFIKINQSIGAAGASIERLP